MASSLLYLPWSKCIQLNFSDSDKRLPASSLLAEHGLSCEDYYLVCNGRVVHSNDVVSSNCCYRIQPRLCGGKGGFGSMLRALGAQIEKTTNREACRDLSGRRMRDVNNEKKLRDWAAKAGEREKAREEKRRERRERIKAAGIARHKYSDPEFDQQKARIAEELDDALNEALRKGSASGSSANANASCSKEESRKRKALSMITDEKKYGKMAHNWMGVDDVDLSSSSSSSGDEDVEMQTQCHQGDNDGRGSCSSSSRDEAGDDVPYQAIGNSSVAETITCLEADGSMDSKLDTVSSSVTSSEDTNGKQHSGSEEKTTPGETVLLPIKLEDFESAKELEKLGLDALKAELMDRGLKCGGTLEQRAQRLFSVKGLSAKQIDKSLLAKTPKTK